MVIDLFTNYLILVLYHIVIKHGGEHIIIASEYIPTLTDNSNNNITDVPYYKYLFVKFKYIKKKFY